MNLIRQGALYWITDEGESIDVTSYDSHGEYLVKHVNELQGSAFHEVFSKGWIRIRVRTMVAGVELKIPSASPKAVKELKELLSHLPSSMKVALSSYDEFRGTDSEVYTVNQFFKTYKSNRISTIVKLSNVQRFRESHMNGHDLISEYVNKANLARRDQMISGLLDKLEELIESWGEYATHVEDEFGEEYRKKQYQAARFFSKLPKHEFASNRNFRALKMVIEWWNDVFMDDESDDESSEALSIIFALERN